MAEGLAKQFLGAKYNFFSAGIESSKVNLNAVKVMKEINIDISHHKSKTLKNLENISLDLVVTVCSGAHEKCPILYGDCEIIHIGFDDPPKLAEGESGEENKLKIYRRVRNEIKKALLDPQGIFKETLYKMSP